MKVHESVISLIGRTPLVKVSTPVEATILVKIESRNPGGSVKDRLALALINQAEEQGLINKSSTIIEPTSGNTGIGLALICATRGYNCTIVMPENMSIERKKMLTYLGARLVLIPREQGMKGAIDRAEQLVSEIPGGYMPRQFDNRVNAAFHEKTTAVEIWEDTGGTLDAFVAGVGTGGTVTGVSRFLKKQRGTIHTVAVEPVESPVLAGGSPASHRIQGIGPGFIPSVYDNSVIDEIIGVEYEDAVATARRLARKDGILCGISSGAAVAAAEKLASRDEFKGKTVVAILPDSAERYSSTPLFEERDE